MLLASFRSDTFVGLGGWLSAISLFSSLGDKMNWKICAVSDCKDGTTADLNNALLYGTSTFWVPPSSIPTRELLLFFYDPKKYFKVTRSPDYDMERARLAGNINHIMKQIDKLEFNCKLYDDDLRIRYNQISDDLVSTLKQCMEIYGPVDIRQLIYRLMSSFRQDFEKPNSKSFQRSISPNLQS